jgi:1,4-dihydroxy-2-naphthoate octaprenyltransferase
MGGFLGGFANWKFSATILGLFAFSPRLFLQILSNLANDYGDSVHGADHAGRLGPKRAVQAGHISAKQMKAGIVVFSLLVAGFGFKFALG